VEGAPESDSATTRATQSGAWHVGYSANVRPGDGRSVATALRG